MVGADLTTHLLGLFLVTRAGGFEVGGGRGRNVHAGVGRTGAVSITTSGRLCFGIWKHDKRHK